MRKVFSIVAILIFAQGICLAQDPSKFHIIFGNRDGSTMTVVLGEITDVPIWGATDPTPGNGDTVTWMYDPLNADGMIITSRNGGYGATVCDSFLAPVGTIQTHVRFASDPACDFYTGGDTILIATFRMTTTGNGSYLGQTVCPFGSGGAQGLLWGMKGGVRSVIPTVSYSCLYFIERPICNLIPGDFNGDRIFNGLDIINMVFYFKGSAPPPSQTCTCPHMEKFL